MLLGQVRIDGFRPQRFDDLEGQAGALQDLDFGVELLLAVDVDDRVVAAVGHRGHVQVFPADFHQDLGSGLVGRLHQKRADGHRADGGKEEKQDLDLALEKNIKEIPEGGSGGKVGVHDRPFLRDLCLTPLFDQFLRQAQILILEILKVFLQFKLSPSSNLNKKGRFSKVSLLKRAFQLMQPTAPPRASHGSIEYNYL